MNEYRRSMAFRHSLEMYAPKHYIMIAEDRSSGAGRIGFEEYGNSQTVFGYSYPFHMHMPVAALLITDSITVQVTSFGP